MKLIRAFSSPVLVNEWPDSKSLNASLKKVILQKEKEEEGIKRSNYGGWHSECDLLSWDEPCIGDFNERVRQMSSAFIKNLGGDPTKFAFKASGWAMVYRDGHYATPHIHPNCVLSGVYYVDTGKPYKGDNNGVLEFVNPRQFNINLQGVPFEEKFVIKPKAGMSVMFRSDLMHMVHPYRGEGTRIGIAYNVSVVNRGKGG